MRTTVRLEDQLLSRAKALAARRGITLTKLLEDALRETLARASPRGVRGRVALPTFTGRGTLPGVDLDDGASLVDLMEGR